MDNERHCLEVERGERDLRSKSEFSAGLERLRSARDAAYLAADSFKKAGNAAAEAQCFGEGIGLEKAAMLIYGKAL